MKNASQCILSGMGRLTYLTSLIEYIKGQAEQHRTESLFGEYRRWLSENSVPYDERYLA
jgi:hypothetical protein